MNGAALTLRENFDDLRVGPNYERDEILLMWFRQGAITLLDLVLDDATGVVKSARAIWPNGAEGRFAAIDIDATHHRLNAWRVTYPNTQRQFEQPALTRDESGAVTDTPDPVVSDWTP